VGPARDTLVPLQTRNLVIGAMPGLDFSAASVDVTPGSCIYVFSDGVFEVVTREGLQWGLPDFLPLLLEPPAQDGAEAARLYRAVSQMAKPGPLDDDFSMLVVTFL
jgi:sigma-B regulation protein RsbU (phosphoserine phosphatase)